MHVAILYNEPVLPTDHPDYLSEAGVLDSVVAFERVLLAASHQVDRLGIGRSLTTLLAQLQNSRIDVVVNLCEGFAGRSSGQIHITGILELLGLPYTGAPPNCISLTHDKAQTKRLLAGSGIPTAEFQMAPNNRPATVWLPCTATVELWAAEQLDKGPLFVKPARQDASLGISNASVVHDIGELADQLRYLHKAFGDAMIEQYIDGREFNVGIIALPDPVALPVAEIQFAISRQTPYPIVTYDGKWNETSPGFLSTPVRCPADLDSSLAEEIQSIALEAFRATCCRDYARVDLRMDNRGEIFVLEVNENPDAGLTAGLARALLAAGISYDQFVLRLVETAAARSSLSVGNALRGVPEVKMGSPAVVTLRTLVPTDCRPLLDLLAQCELFRPDEIEIADEILQESLRDGPKSHYQNQIVEFAGEPVGWSCHGLVPLTDATYDLYWIAVHPAHQQRGIGRQLLAAVESRLRAAGARWLLAETSSTAAYDKTRAFYQRCGYAIVGDVPDFYRADDGRITFGKRLDS